MHGQARKSQGSRYKYFTFSLLVLFSPYVSIVIIDLTLSCESIRLSLILKSSNSSDMNKKFEKHLDIWHTLFHHPGLLCPIPFRTPESLVVPTNLLLRVNWVRTAN